LDLIVNRVSTTLISKNFKKTCVRLLIYRRETQTHLRDLPPSKIKNLVLKSASHQRKSSRVWKI